jgi:hypothetical protein
MRCRAHRDDQSAFTFLIAKYFGYGTTSIRRVFLEAYTWVQHRQKSTIALLKEETSGYDCVNGEKQPGRLAQSVVVLKKQKQRVRLGQ